MARNRHIIAATLVTSLLACANTSTTGRTYVVIAPHECAASCPSRTAREEATCMERCPSARSIETDACEPLTLPATSKCVAVRGGRPKPKDPTGAAVGVTAGVAVLLVIVVLILTGGSERAPLGGP